MLQHLSPIPTPPSRVVVVGAAGFVGKAVTDRLASQGIDVLRVTRQQVDLLAADGADHLAALLKDGDSVVAASAIAPCKNAEMLRDNILLTLNLVKAFNRVKLAHVINIGSDAVFTDLDHPMTENTLKAPDSFHGVMHLAREITFRNDIKVPLTILRPTLIYGALDPHNGYGPNQFRRKAHRGEAITLFGQGEERRDHVFIDDVAKIVDLVLHYRSTGDLNIASGVVTSFHDVAELAVKISGKSASISGSPRSGPMPHNGYRAFDVRATSAAFPEFTYTSLADGMAQAQQTEFSHG